MAQKIPYIPEFPYRGAQILFTSDRVVLHSKRDAIFLFGKKAIGLSSPGRINMDSGEGVTVNAPEVELGLNARVIGEPITKANTVVELLTSLLDDLEQTSQALSMLSSTALEEAVVDIARTTSKLTGTCKIVRSRLPEIKSQLSFTR